MDAADEPARLPADVDALPLVRAALAMRPALRARHEEIEQAQRLPADLVEEMRAAGFYRMVVPRAIGGLEVHPLTYLRVNEALAEGCGAVGWNICNNNIIQLVSLGLPDDGIDEIYGRGGRPVVMAGTAIQGGGKAVAVPGGFRVTGRWGFGSGCMESTWMLGSFQVLDDGEPRRLPDGAPQHWRCFFRREETEIVAGSWNVDGMRGTGSFDWTATDVFVPAHRVMDHPPGALDAQWSRWPGVGYALPVFAWVGPHHCSIITGIARNGIDALIELARTKTPRGFRGGLVSEQPQVQYDVGRADSMLNAGRAYRSAAITELWNTLAAGQPTTIEQRARCRLAASFAADCARDAMDLMYRHGGSTSFRRDSRLSQCWRDLQVVGQAGQVMPEWYPLGGRILLGLEPSPRLT